MLINYSRYKSN